MQLKFESGRSMVEIIGVLAVIGVLSIGGVMGYSYGMDKWRANEVINDVNMRMIDIAGQVFRNQSEITIPEDWDIQGRSGYVIDVFQNTDSEPSIMVERVPTSVCKMILQNSADTQDIYVGVLNGDQVDGNWYLGNNEDICDGSDKEMLFAMSPEILAGFNPDSEDYVEPEGTATVSVPVFTKLECYSNADCDTEKPYCNDDGRCVKCFENFHCGSVPPNYCKNNECYMCPTETPYWNNKYNSCENCPAETPRWNGVNCEACPAETPYWNPSTQTCNVCELGYSINPETNTCEQGCRSNADCNTRTTYCRINSYTLSNNVFSNMKGYCASKGELPNGVHLSKLNTTIYIVKNRRQNWWSAKNYCLVHGKKLFSIAHNRLECYKGDVPFDIDNRVSSGACCARGLTSCSKSGGFSEPMQELYDAGAGGGWLWLDDPSETALGAYAFQIESISIFSTEYPWSAGMGRADQADFDMICED